MAEGTASDNEVLVEGGQHDKRNPVLVPFIICKVVPWVVYAISHWLSPRIVGVVFILSIFDLWICRKSLAYGLVGITWSLNPPMGGCTGIVEYHCEPDPFVPDTNDSNIFWGMLIGNLGLWLLAVLYNLLQLHFLAVIPLVLMGLVQGANVIMFLQCLGFANRMSEAALRSVMTGGGVFQPQTFPEAQELENAGTVDESITGE